MTTNTIEVGGLFRSIVERSPMVNNDEHVVYTKQALTAGDVQGEQLIFSRPVYNLEITAGLKMDGGRLLGRRDPVATLFIDAYWRVKSAFNVYAATGMFNDDLDGAIAYYIAHNYYDCMSGGCSEYVLSILRQACEEMGVGGDTKVYPSEDGWYTISDFLTETDNTINIKGIVDTGRLPSLVQHD